MDDEEVEVEVAEGGGEFPLADLFFWTGGMHLRAIPTFTCIVVVPISDCQAAQLIFLVSFSRCSLCMY